MHTTQPTTLSYYAAILGGRLHSRCRLAYAHAEIIGSGIYKQEEQKR